MDKMIHTSLSAMRGIMNRQTAIANNMANADTIGFRAEVVNAKARYLDGPMHDSRALSKETVLTADMNAGPVTSTGRPLDIALDGDALLAVQAPDGAEAYTRRGDLRVTDSGLLVTGDGHPVLGDGGPVTIPPNDSINISSDGAIFIVPRGGDASQPQELDRLKMASPAGSDIVKHNDTLFRVKDGGVLPGDPDARLTAASLEGSNVNMSAVLVDMIEASRAWETQVKLLSTAKDLDESGARIMSMPT